MFLQLISSNPAVAFVWIVVIFISLTIHEFAHALAGKLKGDRTAEAAGRLTLNPIAHIDPVGLIPLVLLGFGWARPVPFNPYNLRDPKWDAVFIALAGPLANLLMAITAGLILRILLLAEVITTNNLLAAFLILLVIINLFLMFFNLIPIHPLDGSKLLDAFLFKPEHMALRRAIATYGPQVLLMLVILSILTRFDVFFFISTPAYLTCSAITGSNCVVMLMGIF